MLNNLFVDCMTMTVRLTMGWVGLGRNVLIKWWVGLGFVPLIHSFSTIVDLRLQFVTVKLQQTVVKSTHRTSSITSVRRGVSTYIEID